MMKDCSLLYCEWLHQVSFGTAGCSHAAYTVPRNYRVV